MKYKLLREILPLLEEFELDSPNHEQIKLSNFVIWLNTHFESVKFQNVENLVDNERIEVTISRLIGFMGRYAKFYIKKALDGTKLQSMPEFTFLASLLRYGNLTKSELINKNLMEKPTGMEIINRLISNGMIIQENNENDKRSKILKLTEYGRINLFIVFERMDKVADIVVGKLNVNEKMQLAQSLLKLDQFHHDIYFNHKNYSIDDIRNQK